MHPDGDPSFSHRSLFLNVEQSVKRVIKCFIAAGVKKFFFFGVRTASTVSVRRRFYPSGKAEPLC